MYLYLLDHTPGTGAALGGGGGGGVSYTQQSLPTKGVISSVRVCLRELGMSGWVGGIKKKLIIITLWGWHTQITCLAYICSPQMSSFRFV